jgi:hypothetical protein
VLLRPEFFHTYASGMIAGARRDPKGAGRLPLTEAEAGHGSQLRIPEMVRIRDRRCERRVLTATIDELVSKGTAQKVNTHEGSYLVFPRSLARIWKGAPRISERAGVCRFGGAVEDVFSSLVVRFLGLLPFYPESELWKNAAIFDASTGGRCGVLLEEEQGTNEGEITVFFDGEVMAETRRSFLRIARTHIEENGRNAVWRESQPVETSGQPQAPEVFFCHRLRDAPARNLRAIAKRLGERGIRPWLEEWEAHAGEAGQKRALQMQTSEVAAVFFDGRVTPALRGDCEALLRRGCAIVPVILPHAPKSFKALPEFLRKYVAVDFRDLETDPIDRLADGIVETWRTAKAAVKRPLPLPVKQTVFLSYCREDGPLASALRRWVTKRGHEVWWDRSIEPGEDWKQSILNALENSYAAIVCFSHQMVEKSRSGMYPEIMRAIEIANELPPDRTFVVPVRLTPCDIPSISLGGNRTIGDLQCFDFEGKPPTGRSIRGLVEALDKARRQANGG